VPWKEVVSFTEEMQNAGVDYQFIAYADAVHAFTQPSAGNDPSQGAAYNESAAQRSWLQKATYLMWDTRDAPVNLRLFDRVDITEVVITDPNNTLGTLINGANQVSANEVRIDTALTPDFTGDIMVETFTGDDSITIGNLGDMILPGGLMVDGGDGFDNILYTGAGSVIAAGGNVQFDGEEIDFYLGSDLTTTDGDITGNGTGGSGATYQGIHLFDADLTAGGTGAVTLNGSGGDTGNSNHGVFLSNGSTVTTADGNIDIDGSGGGSATSVASKGVMIYSGSSLMAGGTGMLTIDGTAGSGTYQNEGVFFNSGTSASVVDGAMNITGTGGGSAGLGLGVSITNTDLTGTGMGSLTIDGTSAATGGLRAPMRRRR